jgi:hypothetical protein
VLTEPRLHRGGEGGIAGTSGAALAQRLDHRAPAEAGGGCGHENQES